MVKTLEILIAEDDDGHAGLIRRNLERAGLSNKITRFEDGQKLLDFLFSNGSTDKYEKSYLVLLDIRMPQVDGIEVLRRLKQDEELRKIPIIMLTTTDDPKEIEKCYLLGCNNYIRKPVNYEDFVAAIRHLGLFLAIVEMPVINK
jgi:CheY-like chemotaxis protein